MGYHPRIENKELCTLCTIRTRNSELWFINNSRLEDAILGYVAKYVKRYEVTLYGFTTEGSHIHTLAQYPKENQALFNRDLNSCIARAVPRFVPTYAGGRFWGRRYSSEFVPDNEDIERYFFYVVLQTVQDGLVDKISEYPGYNCFQDAINGRERTFEVINWARYNDQKRWDPNVKIKDFKEIVTLKYERLPGYEGLTQKEYKALMILKLEEHRQEILQTRTRPAVGRAALLKIKPGSLAVYPKTSTIISHRPRVLASNPETRARVKAWYFDTYFEYKEASRQFRCGDLTIKFPPGTYRPPPSTTPVQSDGCIN